MKFTAPKCGKTSDWSEILSRDLPKRKPRHLRHISGTSGGAAPTITNCANFSRTFPFLAALATGT